MDTALTGFSTQDIQDAQAWLEAERSWLLTIPNERTRRTYGDAVRLLRRTPGVPPLRGITYQWLSEFGGMLKRRASEDVPNVERLSTSTVNTRLAALRGFFAYCLPLGELPEGLTEAAITKALKGKRSQVQQPYQILNDEEIRRVLEVASRGAEGARAVTLMSLALGSGLRVAELVALRVGDLRTDKHGAYLDVLHGKGDKRRQVPIAQDVYATILVYLRATGRSLTKPADRDTAILLSRKSDAGRRPMTTRQAARIVGEIMRRAGVEASKHISPHSLRHTYAIGVLEGDPKHGQAPASLAAVSELLGHASVSTTDRYLRHFDRAKLAPFAPSLARYKDVS